jgi:hypothetical protein
MPTEAERDRQDRATAGRPRGGSELGPEHALDRLAVAVIADHVGQELRAEDLEQASRRSSK